jgi:hypothetical protein
MKSSWLRILEQLFDKLAFMDFLSVSFIVINILDLFSTLFGILSGKAEETNIIMIGILESYGFLGFVFVKVCFSLLFLIPLILKRCWQSNFWTKCITTGLWLASVILLPTYVIIVIQNILILL